MSNTLCRWVSQKISTPPTEYLLEHEKLIVDEHIEECVHCWEIQQIAANSVRWSQLNPPQLSPFVEKKIISAALEGRMPKKNREPLISGWLRPTLVISSGVVAILLAFLFLFPHEHQSSTGTKINDDASPGLASHNKLSKTYNLLHFDTSAPVKLMRDDKVWATDNAIVNLQVLSSNLTRLELIQGKIVAKVTRRASGEKFEVIGPSGVVEVVGTIFSVEVDDMGMQRVRVLKGAVNVRVQRSGKINAVKEGHVFTVGSVAPVPATTAELDGDRALMNAPVTADDHSNNKLSPKRVSSKKVSGKSSNPSMSSVTMAGKAIEEKLLKEARRHIDRASQSSPEDQDIPELYARLARAYRQQKNYTAAQNIYERLINGYAGSNAARNSIIALGQLELNALGNPQSALAHFDNYLTQMPSGYLAEAAFVGKARALNRMRDRNALRQTANQYLRKYGNGTFSAEMLLYRGHINADAGNCSLAKKDYQAIIDKWPGSQKAKDAKQGLLTCDAVK